jgi:hypothetical protein
VELSKLKANPSTVVELIHPDPEQNPTGITVTLSSRDSEAVKAVMAKAMDKRLAQLRKGGHKPLNQSELEQEAIGALVAAVEGWDGLTEDGKPLPCTPENVRALLTDHAWVRRQLDEAMGNEALFFGN